MRSSSTPQDAGRLVDVDADLPYVRTGLLRLPDLLGIAVLTAAC